MPYLIDGNNLAHALGLANHGLADRHSCARTVAGFCQANGARATIIFDGPNRAGSPDPAPTSRLKIAFSHQRSADEVILRMLSDSKAPRDMTVVTSDKSLGDKARHKGATIERAHEFARRLDRSFRPARDQTSEKSNRKESAEQIQAWLTLFDPGRG